MLITHCPNAEQRNYLFIRILKDRKEATTGLATVRANHSRRFIVTRILSQFIHHPACNPNDRIEKEQDFDQPLERDYDEIASTNMRSSSPVRNWRTPLSPFCQRRRRPSWWLRHWRKACSSRWGSMAALALRKVDWL